MKYKYSTLDKSNISWMENNNNCQTLAKICLLEGQMRCLKPFSIDFRYPISAIGGENGSGKSTLLAIAACAFHNKKMHTFQLVENTHIIHLEIFLFRQKTNCHPKE